MQAGSRQFLWPSGLMDNIFMRHVYFLQLLYFLWIKFDDTRGSPNIFREPQVWGEVSKFLLRNNSQNFHMVLNLMWLGFLSWWRGVRCFSCFIPGRGAWTIIGWVWTTIVLWKKSLDPRKVSLLDLTGIALLVKRS